MPIYCCALAPLISGFVVWMLARTDSLDVFDEPSLAHAAHRRPQRRAPRPRRARGAVALGVVGSGVLGGSGRVTDTLPHSHLSATARIRWQLQTACPRATLARTALGAPCHAPMRRGTRSTHAPATLG